MRFAAIVAAPRHWLVFAGVAATLGTVMCAIGSVMIQVPGGYFPVPLATVLQVGVVLCAVLPLQAWPPDLAAHLARERELRSLRPFGAVVVAVVGIVPAFAWGLLDRDDIKAGALLLAVGIGAVVGLGDYAWLIVCTLGFGAVALDTSPGQPVTAALAVLPWGWCPLAVLASASIYALRGVRATDVN